MKDLKSLQDDFQYYLLNVKQDIIVNVVDTGGMSITQCLHIYGSAYRLQLIEALAANYPVLKQCLDSDVFMALANDYIDHHPSLHYSIRWFGDQLTTFLKSKPANIYPAYLIELSAVEWCMSLVFDAENITPLTLEQISAIPPERWSVMEFTCHPSVYLLNLEWNTLVIWQHMRQTGELLEPQRGAPATWLCWRDQLINHYRSLSADEAWAVNAMMQGITFEGICEGLCEWTDESAVLARALSLLKSWVSEGLITGVTLIDN